MLTIDIHAHIDIPRVEECVAQRSEWAIVQQVMRKALGEQSYQYNIEQAAMNLPKSTDIGLRLKDMDRMGVDIQVISPSPMYYHYWADRELAATLVKDQNEYVAEVCERYPDRFVGLGAVALQHPGLALTQLRDCMVKYKLKGAQICSAYPGAELSDQRFEEFWRLAEELQAVILIHPLGSSLGERTAAYYLANIIGQPLDTTIALAHLIYAGVFDRHPRLKICAVHGGGYLPSYIGRFDHAYHLRPESRSMQFPPGEYLKSIYFDTIVYRPQILDGIIAAAGIEKIVMGTDYPFDMGDYNVQGMIDCMASLDDAGRKAIRGGNATQLLGL